MKGDEHGGVAIRATLNRIEAALAANCWSGEICCLPPPTLSARFVNGDAVIAERQGKGPRLVIAENVDEHGHAASRSVEAVR